MDTSLEPSAATPEHELTSLAVNQSPETTESLPPTLLTTTQRVLEGLSQLTSSAVNQTFTTTERDQGQVLGEVLFDLSAMSELKYNDQIQHFLPKPVEPSMVSSAPHSSSAVASKQVLARKRKASESGAKSPRHLASDEARERIRSVACPIPLPLAFIPPFSDPILITWQSRPAARKEKTPELVYTGIHSFLDDEGYPRPFSAQAQILIEKQQKSWKVSKVSPNVYDQSFADSMINDGRGNLGPKSFSSTGVKDRVSPVVLEEESHAAHAPSAGAEANIPQEKKEMTGREIVFGNLRILERILLYCGEAQTSDTVLRAQGVNKTFERVVKRSMRLKHMLLGERKRRGSILA